MHIYSKVIILNSLTLFIGGARDQNDSDVLLLADVLSRLNNTASSFFCQLKENQKNFKFSD